MDYQSLTDLCKALSISTATGKNWIRLGKLTPDCIQNTQPLFTPEHIAALRQELASGKNRALKSRRNKKYVSGNDLYTSYVSEASKNPFLVQKMISQASAGAIGFDSDTISYLAADCALHLFADQRRLSWSRQQNLLEHYLNQEFSLQDQDSLIRDLLRDPTRALDFCRQYPQLFQFLYCYEPAEDILGLLYLSCKNMGSRKAAGSYYTPAHIVKELLSTLHFDDHESGSSRKILDPACGTGNFLLQLPESIGFEQIHGIDIDDLSVKLARLNMALNYPTAAVDRICQQIRKANFLTNDTESEFSLIIGNPPWGYDFSEEERKLLHGKYKSASRNSIESYDVFIERALSLLSANGRLAFILPEAILNVKAHIDIRTVILEKASIRHLRFLGNAFDGVQCPCIMLQLANTDSGFSTAGMIVHDQKQEFQIKSKRAVSAESFCFTATDAEYKLLEQICSNPAHVYLSGNAEFALGIVTGNNRGYLSSEKTLENEIVLRGSDLCKYHVNPPTAYITFQPEKFQQVAPVERYRAQEKLLYRFICNQLVFAYDDHQTLSLNSCNLLIPRLPNMEIKYVLAILNSRIAQFVFNKRFHSVKVLRSHIESIPIPDISKKDQDPIVAITESLILKNHREQTILLYDELDQMIANLYQLSQEEYCLIKKVVDENNPFL